MDTFTVLSLLLIFGFSATFPVEVNGNALRNDFSKLQAYINPMQIAKTPANTIPIKLTPLLARSSDSTAVPAYSMVSNHLPLPAALADPAFTISPEYKAFLQDAYARLQTVVPAGTGVPIQYLAESDPSFTTSPEYKGFLQDVYARLQDLYESFLERRDALLNLIYCRNCTGNHTAWQNFMNALAHIPSLGWVARPTAELGKPGVSFLVATNENGVVTGVGGTYINNQPIVQYTFNSSHVTPVKPPKPVKPSKLFPVEVEESTTETYK